MPAAAARLTRGGAGSRARAQPLRTRAGRNALGRGEAHELDAHARGALALEAELTGRGLREIDQAVADERAAIVDPQFQLPAIGEIGDPHDARQRQGRMRRAQAGAVEDLAVRRGAAVERHAVPGRDANPVVTGIELRVVPTPGDLVGLAELVDPRGAGARAPHAASARASDARSDRAARGWSGLGSWSCVRALADRRGAQPRSIRSASSPTVSAK